MINKIKLNSTGEVLDIEHLVVDSTKTIDELQQEYNSLNEKKASLIAAISDLKDKMNGLMGDYTKFVPAPISAIIADDVTVKIGEPIAIHYSLEPRYITEDDVVLSTNDDNVVIADDGSICAITETGEYIVSLVANKGTVKKEIKITVTE